MALEYSMSEQVENLSDVIGVASTTAHEFFALRLASHLGEASIAQHYAELMEQYSEGQLLVAYRRALMSHADLSRRFHRELEPLKERSSSGESRGRLAAIRIDRRVVAVAILNGEHLQFADARQLSSSPDKALASAISFITRRKSYPFFRKSSASALSSSPCAVASAPSLQSGSSACGTNGTA